MTPGLALALALGVMASDATGRHPVSAIEAAQEHFYNGRYAEASKIARQLADQQPTLELYELRTSILHFQLRRALGEPDSRENRERAFKACPECADVLRVFMEVYRAGRAAAREAVRQHPDDPDALFYLGKLDLNYVWLALDTLGRRTGWGEYWEARRSLDTALDREPEHLRARVARAWIDYVVDTKTPWGTGWLLGGGSKKKALAVMHEAVEDTSDYYANAEALFGLWDMQVRERRGSEALETARRIVTLFPGNAEVQRFVSSRAQ
jgi:tetratricopeptide (TPR) repeat protein